MSAVLVEIAEAVNSELATAFAASTLGAGYSAIVPKRSYADWDDELKDMGTLHVDVVPVAYDDSSLNTHASIGYVNSVDIGIRKRFGTANQQSSGELIVADVDALVLLVEQVSEFFTPRRLTAYDSASWRETKIRATYVREHLRQCRQFTGVIRVSFDATKDL